MPQLEARLLGPGYGAQFSREELSYVRVEPVGDAYVFYCNKCHWNVMKREQAPVLQWGVARDGAREVIEHYKGAHK